MSYSRLVSSVVTKVQHGIYIEETDRGFLVDSTNTEIRDRAYLELASVAEHPVQLRIDLAADYTRYVVPMALLVKSGIIEESS